ncbi:MAG: phosphoglycerate kinase [Oscillospiraceae bacterium]
MTQGELLLLLYDEIIKQMEGAKVIIVSHMGRPKEGREPHLSLKPIAERLSQLLGQPVKMADDAIGGNAKELANSLQNGEVLMLENIRYYKEETKNDPEFAKKLASYADIYVNDAFGCAHRAHASTYGVADYLPAACGYLIQKEIEALGSVMQNPKHPFVAILGGAKVSDKIGVINNLIGKVDTLIVGGGMAYTFLKAMGKEIGNSLCEEDKVELAEQLIAKAKDTGTRFLLPIDHKIADRFAEDAQTTETQDEQIPLGYMGLDIGPKTIELYKDALKDAATVVWNGPLGVFEFDNFSKGTFEVAQAIANSGAVSIVGGGDSVAAVTKLGIADKMSHISTGGGASLEFLEGKVLPGIACLDDK